MIGKRVRFKSGRNAATYEAVVTGEDGIFYITKDDAGNVRKVRKGGAQPVDGAAA